ncbi:MAG TPA: FAD-dependent oxidoreductase [Acetobacteraceae bacterium]|nr:FAD-dependent oxidoreductase [Acetobacteraceae bacterium]
MTSNHPGTVAVVAVPPPALWHREADIVVIGSGATGLPAAIVAREAGASVILVEAEPDIGGHAITSGGNVPLGGGTSAQRAAGIEDSPDLVFLDNTDWSVVQPNGFPDYRYNDRELVRAFADENVATYDWLLAHGVVFADKAPDSFGGTSIGNSVPREMHAVPMHWTIAQTGKPEPAATAATRSTGNGLMRPLEAAACKVGVEILLQHRMTAIHRETPGAGRVTGIRTVHEGNLLDIRARKAVIIAMGGHTGNVEFRRQFDPRLTAEYCGLAGMPWSDQDASGEIAAMAIGASLWGLYNQTGEFGLHLTKPFMIGTQYNYRCFWQPGSSVFHKARATGLPVNDWQNVITVNMVGQRFFDETEGNFSSNNHEQVKDYRYGDYRNARNIAYRPVNWVNAALAGIGDGHNGGGPIWAIFDAAAARREKWITEPPYVDRAAGFFFSANTIAELACSIEMQHQRVPMPVTALEATVARYNSFADSGIDADFGKPSPMHKIMEPPFHAAWATPTPHDSRAGLRINARCQVIDRTGQVIAGLYCGGESAGGFSQHGLARALVQGLIAGRNAMDE